MNMSVYENYGDVKPTVSSYLWEVKNVFDACKNTGDYLASPIFSTVYSSVKQEWRLHLFPKGFKDKDKIAIFVKYLGQSSADVNVTISLLDDKYCKVIERDFQRLFEAGSSAYGYPDFEELKIVNDKANRIVVNDTISVLCELTYDRHVEENLPDYSRLEEFDEFEKLLDAENSTDITVMIGKEEIKVHKAIIMNRSPVFRAMFEHNMKEKEQNIVEITDIKYEVMKEVFRFMYVGKINGVEKIATDLLVAAEKYSIKGLKVLCEKQLFEDLTVTNVIEYFKLADMCNTKNLKSKIIKFIVYNQKDIIRKPELKLLPSELIYEVLSAVIADNLNK